MCFKLSTTANQKPPSKYRPCRGGGGRDGREGWREGGRDGREGWRTHLKNPDYREQEDAKEKPVILEVDICRSQADKQADKQAVKATHTSIPNKLH